jgi:hypothetical protein
LLNACPNCDYVMDDFHGIWWSLARIKNIPNEYEHNIGEPAVARSAATYLFFADYLIWSSAWAIACGDDENRGRIVSIGSPDRFVADSFAEFVERYVKNDPDL